MRTKTKAKNEVVVNNALLNMLAPMGLSTKRNSIVVGENTGKVYGIVKYPQELNVGWLSKITNIPGTLVSVTFNPLADDEIIGALNNNAKRLRGKADVATDSLTQQRATNAADNCDKLILDIDRKGETVGELGITIMPIANDEDTLAKIERRIRSICAPLKCKPRLLANNQLAGFKQISPTYTNQDVVNKIVNRVAPLRTVVGGFPFSSSGFNDGTGYYFGRDVNGGLIILDPWKRGNDRTNSNFVIMGVAGVGKSTKVKDIIISEYMMGTKIIIIDPEREYKDLCKNLKGDWINAGGGLNGKINPLQIRGIPVDDEEEDEVYKDEGHGMGAMALYIKHLEIFFSLYLPSLTDVHKAILKEALIELYNKFGIEWDTDVTQMKNEEFPFFIDLYNLLLEKGKAAKKTTEDNVYEHLALLLKDAAMGSDSFLWNGATSINTHSRCICLDTNNLQDTSDAVKRTQYFNILSWAWNEMSKDRNEKVLLICDEAYLMIDPNVPQSLVFLRNAEKRGRKYEAALAIISHSVVDFLDPRIKMYGQALLDIPCYKILMGSDGKNLSELKELYNLTDAEEELLASKQRKHALVMVGAKRMHMQFDIPEYKFDYFGSAGGR